MKGERKIVQQRQAKCTRETSHHRYKRKTAQRKQAVGGLRETAKDRKAIEDVIEKLPAG